MTPQNDEEREPVVEPTTTGVYTLMIHRTVDGSDPLVREPLGDGG
jgi:hypothetical protein